MKIRHRDYGEVDGVERYELSRHWEKQKDGAHMIYYQCDGWYEVTETRYVDVTGACHENIHGGFFIGGWSVPLPSGHKLRKVEWFDLPNNLVHEIHYMTAKGFIEYIQRFKKPCLIVEKEEG